MAKCRWNDSVDFVSQVTPESLTLTKACNATIKSPCIMDITFVKMVYFQSFMYSLEKQNYDSHVVFLDPDLLILQSIQNVFSSDFDIGITVVCGEIGLMNPGVVFCHKSHLGKCRRFHEEVVQEFIGNMFAHTGDQRSFGTVTCNIVKNYSSLFAKVMQGKTLTETSTGNDPYVFKFMPGYVFNATPGKLVGRNPVILHYKGPLTRKKMLLEHYQRFYLKNKSHLFLRKIFKKPTSKDLECKPV